MERVNRIWQHETYQDCLKKILEHEKEREFCRHTPEHFLDVARLTWILALEQGIEAEKEIVYAAGLLHDIGRFLQYEQGIPHEKASAGIAAEILKDCGFSEEEQSEILGLILSHRSNGTGTELAGLFYQADKLSRNCFLCQAQEECDWPETKKNLHIRL